jgi:Acetyltransferase (GNAT) family.
LGELEVRSITNEEFGTFVAILREAAAWLRDQGREMWTEEQVAAKRLIREYAMREMFIGYTDGEEAAAAMILQEADPLVWLEETERADSLYVHKLCVRRAFAATGCSSAMLQWAKEQAVLRGKTWLRLDCAADRPKLCTFYERNGFVLVREKSVHGNPTVLYECRAE